MRMKLYLGFDVGGTKCAVSLGGVRDGEIELVGRSAFETPGDWRQALERMFAEAERLVDDTHCDRALLAGCGFSCGGPLDARAGLVLSPPNLPGWDRVPVTRLASERLGLAAFLENDANACALAEWQWGAGRNVDSMAFLTFGTGLGAGLILDGRLYRGANGNAGEVGHLRLERFGPAGYGKAGSFEGFCSGGGIAQLAVTLGLEARQRGEAPSYLEEGAEAVTAKKVAQAAQAGDPTAVSVFERCGEMLGRGLSLLVDVINPQRIVIGSIYARCTGLLAPAMQKSLREEALAPSLAACQVVPAALGERIGDCAALCVAHYGLMGG